MIKTISRRFLLYVDFIATKTDETLYIQATESMVSKTVRRRELALLQKIRDNYGKFVLSMDPGLVFSYNGVTYSPE